MPNPQQAKSYHCASLHMGTMTGYEAKKALLSNNKDGGPKAALNGQVKQRFSFAQNTNPTKLGARPATYSKPDSKGSSKQAATNGNPNPWAPFKSREHFNDMHFC